MKRNIILLTMTMLMVLPVTAQETLSVNITKDGQLAKAIGKNPSEIKKMEISGSINKYPFKLNEKDLNALAQCVNLTDLTINTRFEWESGLPSLPSLRFLRLSSGIRLVSDYPNLKHLFIDTKNIGGIVGNVRVIDQYSNLKFEIDTVTIVHQGSFFRSGNRRYITKNDYCKTTYLDKLKLEVPESKVKAKYLIISSINELNESDYSRYIDPNFIYCKNEKALLLNRWDDSFDISKLENITMIFDGAFANTNISEVRLPKHIEIIPWFCFANCKNLKSVVAEGVTEIKDFAFVNSSLQELKLPESIKVLGVDAFKNSNVSKVTFIGNYAPELVESDYKNSESVGRILQHSSTWFESNVQFIVPKGRLQAFNIGAWKRANVKEAGAQSGYTFEVKKPGTLATMLTDAIAPKVESLTIKGLLYDTDLAAISKCKNLRDLDLGHSFICWSPATIKQKMGEKQFEMAYVAAVARTGLADEAARAKAGRGSVAVSEYMGMVAKDFEKAAKYYSDPKNFKGSDDCVLPNDDIDKLTHLERIVFPAQLKTIKLWLQTKYLKEIVLPPYLERIEHLLHDKGDYKKQDVAAVRNIVFPSTLKYIGDDCFNGFVKLESVDLSNTQVESIGQNAFMYCKNLKTFKGSKFLKEIGYRAFEYIFNPDTGKRSTEGYFYTMEGPNGLFPGEFGKVHVPRGAKAGYRNSSGGTIVDDIEE